MTETISISPKPGIKCFPRNIRLGDMLFYDTVQAKPEKIRKLAEKERLWTGESAYCICTHHVKYHCTVREQYGSVINIHCHGNGELCNCELFRTRSMRIDLSGSHSNYTRTVMEDLADV